MDKFEFLGLSDILLNNLVNSGYETPTAIQQRAIPYILQRRDVVAIAQTGTGKTAAFCLPIMDIMAHTKARARLPRCLILEPTRELAIQVEENFKKLGVGYDYKISLFIGGVDISPQKRQIQSGIDIIIATPGRLLDLVERGGLLLNAIDILVIDEADRMMDMGFIPDIEKILNLLPKTRQSLLFSATMPPVIKKLTAKFMNNPMDIMVSRPATTAETIDQFLILYQRDDKLKKLEQLILAEEIDKSKNDSPNSAIIFCNKKISVDDLSRYLMAKKFAISPLHGDMEQSTRIKNLQRFKDGQARILICSDVAARGLDIPSVSHVINFDVPLNADDYVHRIGRTGRAGRSGRAFMFFDQSNKIQYDNLMGIEELIQKEIVVFEEPKRADNNRTRYDDSDNRQDREEYRPRQSANRDSDYETRTTRNARYDRHDDEQGDRGHRSSRSSRDSDYETRPTRNARYDRHDDEPGDRGHRSSRSNRDSDYEARPARNTRYDRHDDEQGDRGHRSSRSNRDSDYEARPTRNTRYDRHDDEQGDRGEYRPRPRSDRYANQNGRDDDNDSRDSYQNRPRYRNPIHPQRDDRGGSRRPSRGNPHNIQIFRENDAENVLPTMPSVYGDNKRNKPRKPIEPAVDPDDLPEFLFKGVR